METDSIRDKLDAIKQRKLILLAEVRFLRLRHKDLLEANYQTTTIQQQNLKKTNSKSNPKSSRQLPIRKDKGVKISNNNNNSNKTRKMDHASSSAALKPFHFAKPKEKKGNKPAAMNFDSSKERLISKDGSVHDKVPFFDLNQISREELEFQDEEEKPKRIEEMKRSVAMTREGTDEHGNELKLAMCRSMGNGNHRTSGGGKRKISWQDPVALKV